MHYTTPTVLGGVEQVMGVHAAALRAAGHDVTIVAGRGGVSPRGVRIARVPEADSRNPIIERDKAALMRGEVRADHEKLVARLTKKLRAHLDKADRVVVHNAMTMPMNFALTAALWRLAAERPGVFVAWTHDIAAYDPRYDAYKHDGEPWDLIRRAAPGVRYVTVSQERASQWSQLARVKREDISVVTNGVDVGVVLGLSIAGAHLVERLGLLDADPLLLQPVRLTRRKRVEAAIDATAELRRRGRNAMLVVTGAMGPHDAKNRSYLAELAARANKVEGVHLLAALGIRVRYEQVVDLYALADVLVFPSESEGFGIPMLEAGLHRMPIVCSDIPALRETGGDDPIYIPADASGSVIADAVELALSSPVMGMRARSMAHAWPRVLRERVLPVILDDAR
ncbi:MAG TPA: glycosyltransferase family 4 protein [Candidatus Limnocylindrales bacterium]|nr:glycosyltransferase family 4 protein [Candidatus Limnocylindrales bacterium]